MEQDIDRIQILKLFTPAQKVEEKMDSMPMMDYENMGHSPEWGDGMQQRKMWDALSMSEKAAMMKAAIKNGITDLSNIKREYNAFALGGHIEGVHVYKGGGKKSSGNSWTQGHQQRWYNFLTSQGYAPTEATRLSGFFAAQDAFETGGGTSSAARTKNNFGGMQSGGKNITYPSQEAYMKDKLRMMKNRFPDAMKAQTLDEYATILGDPSRAGKGYLYYVTDNVNYNPKDPNWIAAQTKHMHNYINGMRYYAGQGRINFNDPASVASYSGVSNQISLPPRVRQLNCVKLLCRELLGDNPERSFLGKLRLGSMPSLSFSPLVA